MGTKKQSNRARFARQAKAGTGKVGRRAKSTAAPKPKRKRGKAR